MAEHPSYRIIYEGTSSEYIEKKSRFIATVMPVSTEEEAVLFIEAMKKKYWDARHNCSAFIVGERGQLSRSNDDGEPSGTAGKPILEVLTKKKLTNTAVVVTRYFGGILLGAGGLIRAYTQAAAMGIDASKTGVMEYGSRLTLKSNYSDSGKIIYELEQRKINVTESRYTDNVETDISIPFIIEETLRKSLTQITSGRVRIEKTGEGYYLQKNENLI